MTEKQLKPYLESKEDIHNALNTLRQFFFSGKGYELEDEVSAALQNLMSIVSHNISLLESQRPMSIRQTCNVIKSYLFSSQSMEELPENVWNAVQDLFLCLAKGSRVGLIESDKYKHYKNATPVTELDDDVNANVPNRQTFIAYKQFATHYNPNDPSTKDSKGLLYPLYIGADKGIKVGKWYKCGEGELAIKVDDSGEPSLDKSGNPVIKVKTSNGKLGGTLSYRPGWHLGSAPVTRHIGVPKDVNGNSLMSGKEYDYMRPECVWAEVEYSAQRDYTNDTPKCIVKSGQNKGQVDRRKACFDNADKFSNGFYHYQTNNNANSDEDWLIANAIRVKRVLTDDEVEKIASSHGLKAQLRDIEKTGGAFIADLDQFKESFKLKSMRLQETNWVNRPVFEVEDSSFNVLASEKWVKGFIYNMYLEDKEDTLDSLKQCNFDVLDFIEEYGGSFVKPFADIEDFVNAQIFEGEAKDNLQEIGFLNEDADSDYVVVKVSKTTTPTITITFYNVSINVSSETFRDICICIPGFTWNGTFNKKGNTVTVAYDFDNEYFVDTFENDNSVDYVAGFNRIKRANQ